MKVLVVDDLEEARRFLRRLLEKNGFSVTTASNGQEALEAIRRSPPDLIVSDILMPEMDGFQFCREVRQDERFDRIPFIFYTATYTDPRDEDLAMKLGADGFIVKPAPIASLVARIRKLAEDAKKGRMDKPRRHQAGEEWIRSLYDRRLVEKLEKKAHDLEQENRLRRQRERELEETNRRLRLHNRIAEVFLTVSGDEVYRRVLDLALAETKSPHGIFGYIDEDRRFVCPSMTRDICNECRLSEKNIVFLHEDWENFWGMGAGYQDQKSSLSNEPFTVPDGHISIRRALGVPLKYAGQMIGNIIVANKTVDYTSSDRQMMETLADHVAPILHGWLERQAEQKAREKAEKKLKDSVVFFQTLIDTLPSPVFYKDAKGRYLGGNRAWSEQIVGLPLADVAGKTVFELPYKFQPELAEKIHEVDLSLMQTGAAEDHETRMQSIDGQLRDFMVKKAVFYDAEGKKAGIVGLMFDLSEKNRAEAERRKLEEQLRHAVKMEAVGTLAGGVAHDFNNLLTTILGCVHLMEAEKTPGQPVDEDLEEIKKAAQRAAHLTQQLLAFSRKQRIRPQVFDLNRQIAELEKLLRRTLGENIRLILELASDLSPVRADPGQIDQVLINLAVNAGDAMPNGGRLTIETNSTRLEPSFFTQRQIDEASGNYVRLRVSDTGTGMPPEVLEQIFDPFFTTKKRGRGTGLGLSTVYGIVQQNGGFVLADSEPGQGTTVTVYLPECPEGVSAGESSGPAPGADSGRGVAVLVVEDDRSARRVVRQSLKGEGFDVVEAESAEQALALAPELLDRVHLLLTDVILPGMDGVELARRLESLRPDIAVLFMSGYAEDREAVRELTAASDRYIEKPIDPEALIRKIAAVLSGLGAE